MNRGSVMRKWDLHVHTPDSFEHHYAFSSTDEREKYKGDIWDKFVAELESVQDVSVLGITDYFSVDGYKKVLEYRKKGRLGNFELVLPNVELRLDKFVGRRSLNFHVILSEDLDPKVIEKEFLEELYIPVPGGEYRRLNRENIDLVGKILKEQHAGFRDDSDYVCGCKSVVVSLDDVQKALESNKAFAGRFILALAEPEWSAIDDWKGRDHLTRKNILVKSHIIFSPSSTTREWGLGEKHSCEDDFIAEFGALKPCIHGSDAHSFERLCAPDQDRFCWIKADPTFEGLRQITYEPRDRVVVSSRNPEPRKNIYTLDRLKIGATRVNDDLAFDGSDIELNRNLVAIIGGKGSGKTAMLDLIANCFEDRCFRGGTNRRDRNSFVQRIEADNPDLQVELGFIGPGVDDFEKDFVETRFFEDVRVMYLPQGQIEEFSGDRDRLNEKIEEIVFGSREVVDGGYEGKFEELKGRISDFEKRIREINSEISLLEEESSDEKLDGINSRLGEKRGELQDKQAELQDIIDKMSDEAQKKIEELRTQEKELAGKRTKIEVWWNESEELGKELEDSQCALNSRIERLNSSLSEFVIGIQISLMDFGPQGEAIEKARGVVAPTDEQIEKEMKGIGELLGKLEGFEKAQAEILQAISAINDQIASLESEASEVKEIRQRIESLEQERLHTYVQIVRGFQEWKAFYKEVIETFSKDASEILSAIRFESGVHFDRQEFANFGAEILNLRKVTTEQIKELADMLEEAIAEDSEEGVIGLVTTYRSKILEYRNYLKSRWTRADFYGWAFKNYFSLTTDIFFNDVAMEKLSIGQKGTVLLKLFLAEGDYPLIVDMPEENLDNKFIYDELVGAFRQAKTNRQLIVATNNANLVVNTDAEQVIVAECKDNVIRYQVGAIEDRGIRDEITTILEGGKEALRKREQKYGMQVES